MASLCDDCATVDKNGVPCAEMFTKEDIERCSAKVKDAAAHKKLADAVKKKTTAVAAE